MSVSKICHTVAHPSPPNRLSSSSPNTAPKCTIETKKLASVLCDVATIFSCQRTGGTEVPYLFRELKAPRGTSDP